LPSHGTSGSTAALRKAACCARSRPHAVVAADHPLAANCPQRGTTLAAVADHPLILADQGLSLGHMRALFSARGLPFTVAHRTATH
jgi:hypothetical protein